MKAYLQKMGRSLMLPVATLPVAALFMGIGYWIDPAGWGGNNLLAAFLIKGGSTILDNLGILFAVGLAFGMSKDKSGPAALAGLVSFMVPMTLLVPTSIQMFKGIEDIANVDPAFSAINMKNVFIGILAGLVAAALYNRFSNVKLPMALSFFSGKRAVPIITAGVMMVISAALIFVWPPVYDTLVSFGKLISELGPLGAGLYGFFNRLLIPTGLHHALNNVFWFNLAGIDDISKFWASEGVKGITGMYQAGFFPVMMFGLPAGAYAIYRNARPEKKKVTASLMLAAGFASFFTGVTEPLEFSFMFVAWPLYVVHAILTGISMFVSAAFHWTAGFNFSAGLVDFILSLRVPIANKPWMLLVQGLVFAVIYYFTFNFVIKKFNLMTPGREAGNDDEAAILASSDDKFSALAKRIYAGLGGADNITSIDNCTTRLRLQVKDTGNVDQQKIKATGVPGVKVIDKKNIQVIVGTEVQFVADEMSKLYDAKAKIDDSELTQGSLEKKDNGPHIQVTEDIYAPVSGNVKSITEVSDDVFSSKMMGDGFAVIPENGKIYSPVAGTISNIFPTKHALGITTPGGVEVLVHMGIDTVQLKGEGFEILVTEGQKVTENTAIANINLDLLKEKGKQADIIVAFTNQDHVESFNLAVTGNTSAKASIGKLTTK